jgi:tetratricopeptide (TPR) repeat protein
VDSLPAARSTDHFGLAVPPAVFARSHLVWCLTELGDFEEAERVGAEAARLAEVTGEPETLQWAYYPLGLLALERGDAQRAVTHLERVLSICRTAELPVYIARTRAALGHAYVRLDRVEHVRTVEEAVAEAERRQLVYVHTAALLRLGDVYLTVGRADDAAAVAGRAVDLARQRGARGAEARGVALQATIDLRLTPPKRREAEDLYRAALSLAAELEMRALAAEIERCLAELSRGYGR